MTVTWQDGVNLGYSYEDVLNAIHEKYIKNNYTKSIDGIKLRTKLVHGTIYKVNYTVFMHDNTEHEKLHDYV